VAGRRKPPLEAVVKEIEKAGGRAAARQADVAAPAPGLIGGAPYGAAKAGVLNLMGHVHAVLRDKGIRATTIMPAEVDTPILEKRPLPPDAKARATMMQPEDVASAVLLCVTLPKRTVIEEIIMSPTIPRDQSADIEAARRIGEPGSATR
jgi:NADP-dependent 3-hydroxy acid dehydrogenase YdfG